MTTDVLIRSVAAVSYRVPLRATLTSALGDQSHSTYGLVRLGVVAASKVSVRSR